MGFKEFIDWNKKIFADERPVVGFQYEDDGQGNKSLKMQAFGSKIQALEKAPEEPELVEDMDIEVIELTPQKKKELLLE